MSLLGQAVNIRTALVSFVIGVLVCFLALWAAGCLGLSAGTPTPASRSAVQAKADSVVHDTTTVYRDTSTGEQVRYRERIVYRWSNMPLATGPQREDPLAEPTAPNTPLAQADPLIGEHRLSPLAELLPAMPPIEITTGGRKHVADLGVTAGFESQNFSQMGFHGGVKAKLNFGDVEIPASFEGVRGGVRFQTAFDVYFEHFW